MIRKAIGTFVALIVSLVALPGALAAAQQTQTASPASKPAQSTIVTLTPNAPPVEIKPGDYSNEGYVIESRSTKATFESDGTESVTIDGRVRIQSQAGVHQFGVLNFPYASATGSEEVVYVRVIKPNKRVIETPAENVLDMPAEITRQAPFYSDIKELQVAVKGLEAGDVLETQIRSEVKKPLDPGQFWETFQFFQGGIVLQETLEVRVPRDRKVQVKSAAVQPAITEDGEYRVYTWKTSNLARKKDTDQVDPADQPPPAVQLTSFQNWDEVAQWMRSLFAPRATPSPEIQAKAAELTRGATTDAEKMRAIYAFVSSNYRYIGIGLGIGRYQPHSAADVLSNDYGDCKDKHTLLASLLAAVGVKAYPALINSTRKIDPDMPSPAQFDHVITAIPQGKGFLFLDSTAEVGPFGYLVPSLRDKQALVIRDSGPAELVQTPADPPIPNYFNFRADASLDSSGTLKSKVQMTFRGDAELPFRLALRRVGQTQWNDAMQGAVQAWGFGGTVTDATATAPDATDTPLQIEYNYERKKYSDWEDKQITPPFPPIFFSPAPTGWDKNPKPIELGQPAEIDYKATIKLPPGMTADPPVNVSLEGDFANYTAVYSVSDGVVHAERHLVTKERKVPVAELPAYEKFGKAIDKDTGSYIVLSGPSSSASHGTAGTAEAGMYYGQGEAAWQKHDMEGAEHGFRNAVDKDPNFAMAWGALGEVDTVNGDTEKGIGELKKAIALDPNQAFAYRYLTSLLIRENRTDEAIAVLKQIEKAAPDNKDAPGALGSILMNEKRYSEAIPEFQTAARLSPADALVLSSLGDAYARTGDKDKALATWAKAMQADSSSMTLNNVAYEMADNNLDLSDALKYAEEAVNDEESVAAKTDLNNLTSRDLAGPVQIAMYWDTLGWVYFRMGQVDKAENYVDASWRIGQDPVVGDHLGQIYEKEGKEQKAIMAYESAAGGPQAVPHAKERLEALSDTESDDYTPNIVEDTQKTRIFKVQVAEKPEEQASAEFFILFSAGGKVAGVKILRASAGFPGAEDVLKSVRFDVTFPDDGQEKILRRGMIDCEPEIPGCTIALTPPAYVRTLN